MKIYNSENWFYKLGIAGFCRILQYNKDFHDLDLDKYDYSINDDFIEFDVSLLDDFPTYYYNFFINEYNISKSMNEKLNWQLSQAKDKDKFKDKLKDIKKIISDRNKKVDKLKVEEYKECKDIESSILKIKYEQIDELQKLLERYMEIVSVDYINNPMTVTYFKFILSNSFFGQMSFLNVCNNSKTIDEQKQIFYKDYVKPVIDSVKFQEIINENDEDILKKYIEDKQNENKECNIKDNEIDKVLNSFKKDLFGKKRKIASVDAKLQTFNKCSLCDDNISFGSDYSDGSFIPLAISNENSKNLFWNFNDKFPICPLCKLVLFCTPAGCTKIFKKYMNDKLEYNDKLYYGFISIDGSLKNLIRQNDNFRDISSKDGIFDTFLLDIIKQSHKISEWQLQNILYVEFNADYKSKNSKLNYFNIPTYLARFLKNDYAMLEKINDTSERMRAFDVILKRNDLKHIIDSKLRDTVKGNAYALNNTMNLIKVRNYINQYKKGCKSVDVSTKKRIDAIYFQGIEVADTYRQKNNENQLSGISYKLLNAAKADNKKDFMDTIIRIYMSIEKNIPMLFLEIMKEEKLDFAEIAHSFITGLNSKIKESNKED